jgi:hypothetical protein
MIIKSAPATILCGLLLVSSHVYATEAAPVPAQATQAPASATQGSSGVTSPAADAASAAPAVSALPAMYFLGTVASDELYDALRKNPAFSTLDKELVGSPLTLMVTHTLRPTAGGQAAGLLSAVLSGSTLGLIPIVSNERLVVKYEVLLNGKPVTSYSFERTATRAQNLWTAGADGYGGLGKAGLEWVKSTTAEAAAKIASDPALLAVRDEIEFYFPPKPTEAK